MDVRLRPKREPAAAGRRERERDAGRGGRADDLWLRVLNRLSSIDYSDTTSDVSLIAFDGNGNRTQMTDGSGQESYVYDPLNRLTSLMRRSDAFSYGYDLMNLTEATYPGGFSTSYAYDDDERLQSATSGGLTTSYALRRRRELADDDAARGERLRGDAYL